MPFDPKSYEKYEYYTVTQLEEGFIHVQYTNPKTLNAFTDQNWKDYGEIFTRLDKEEDVILIVFSSGVSKAFSSGLNLKTAMEAMSNFGEASEEERIAHLHKHIVDFQNAISVPARISTPTIGVLNGINYGLALDISSAFSIRIAVEGARFSIAEVNIGIAADIGSLQRLPALVNNKSRLMQHALLGDIFDDREALELGYVSIIHPSVEHGIEQAKEWAEKILQTPQWAIKGTKKHIQDMLNGQNMEKGLKDIAHYNSVYISGSKLKLLVRPYTSCSIPTGNILARSFSEDSDIRLREREGEGEGEHQQQQFESLTVKDTLSRAPSRKLKYSYRHSSVFASTVKEFHGSQIKTELVKSLDQSEFTKLATVLEAWSYNDVNAMITTLGRETISEYISLIIGQNRGQVRRHDIYNSEHLTGHRLITSDFENLMELELIYFKPDLASKWFRSFRNEHGINWKKAMTPKLWTLAFRVDGFGENRLWTIPRSELSSYFKKPAKSNFIGLNRKPKLMLQDVVDDLSEFDLDFHSAALQHMAYAGQMSSFKEYIKSVWGIGPNGDLVSDKVDVMSHLYPNDKLLIDIFVSLSFCGEFYTGIKYINGFQTAYDQMESKTGSKAFWEQVFKWADISTRYENDIALNYFLRKSNCSKEMSLEDAKQDVNFDYEGFLQFLEKLKNERINTCEQIWKGVHDQKTSPVPFSNSIYKTYLDILKENPDENKLYEYMTCLLKEFHRYHTDDQDSFTRRSGMGFHRENSKSESVWILYLEAMKMLIDLKGFSPSLWQVSVLIDKWSIDKKMKKELSQWVQKDRMKRYKEELEIQREKFMANLAKDDESLLELM
ncbi:hypothetical protein KGF56_004294 [Candida oxycetoniae]|uniref:ATPase expression protein 2, mitochondrial n=1 Tax=Candida oxycetoniae TaxID=497107 RepID=A0AAI9SUC3_9ASCO|nr:uncharacterized protein KGF56_004294 [Candida oxycetoniae]KAI3402833.2 hypothetical protein KGF56_004294 [Candida oxycetoniae]